MTTKRINEESAKHSKKAQEVEYVTRKQPKGVREIHLEMFEGTKEKKAGSKKK